MGFQAAGGVPLTAAQSVDLSRGGQKTQRGHSTAPNKKGPWLRPDGGWRRRVNGGMIHRYGETGAGGGGRGNTRDSVTDI